MDKRSNGTLTYTTWGIVTLFFWLLFGEFAIAMRERSAVPTATELLRQHHASDTIISIMIGVIPMALAMILGPIISYKSDRYRSPRGRRIPFLMWQTPVGAIAMMGLGFAPWLGRETHLLFETIGIHTLSVDFLVLTYFVIFWSIFECIAIMTLAIYAGLVNDVVPKPLLGRFYAGFRIVSLGAGIFFNKQIFEYADTHLMEIFVSIGLLFGVGAMLMCLKVKEGEYPPPEAEETGDGHPHGFISLAKSYFVECFAHSYYVWIFCAIMFATLGPFPFNTFNQIYAGKLGITKAELGDLLGNSFIISLCLAPLIGMAVDKFSALKISMITCGMGCLTYFFGYFFIEGGAIHAHFAPFGLTIIDWHTNNFSIVYMLHVVISGAFFTAVASLPMALFPKSRFMQFNSAVFLAVYGAQVVVGLIQGPILDASHHDYKLTLLGGAFFDLLGVICLYIVLRNFKKLPNGEAPVFTK
jgi:maltose/moltooligosaccharide transporter